LRSIAQEAGVEPVSARIRIGEDGRAVVEAGKSGYAIDVKKSLETARRDLSLFLEGKWRLTDEEIEPAVSTEEAESWRIEGIIATFTTHYDASQTNRANNLELAAKTLDCTLVLPGEVFSFNETVGPRTTAAGYREAPIIRDKKLTPGIGGGVCQVATTLFNTALEAGMPVVERFPHTLRVSYVPEGRDASVSYGVKDM
ncbi:MAG: VanW family protein, partial [Clostridiales bacterium]|nr:VanW family protein [Clostridiales bacterium]